MNQDGVVGISRQNTDAIIICENAHLASTDSIHAHLVQFRSAGEKLAFKLDWEYMGKTFMRFSIVVNNNNHSLLWSKYLS